MAIKTGIWWVRRDLRLHDNRALPHETLNGWTVHPLDAFLKRDGNPYTMINIIEIEPNGPGPIDVARATREDRRWKLRLKA